MIEGVEIKELITHEDERGFFCEIIRNSDNIKRESNFEEDSEEQTD